MALYQDALDVWVAFAASALSNAMHSDEIVAQKAQQADRMLEEFFKRYEWYDGASFRGWKRKAK